MKKLFRRDNIITESKNTILKKYANDINQYYEEYWIGEKGTTTLKCLIWYDCLQSEGEGYFIEYGVTVQELRSNDEFLRACLNDSDVNHALDEDINGEGTPTLKKEALERLMRWYLGEENAIPISPCGLYNYCDYFDINR